MSLIPTTGELRKQKIHIVRSQMENFLSVKKDPMVIHMLKRWIKILKELEGENFSLRKIAKEAYNSHLYKDGIESVPYIPYIPDDLPYPSLPVKSLQKTKKGTRR